MTGPNPFDHAWWLASRSSGIVALLAVSISVIIGLMMANGLPRKPGAKRQLLAVHESTALAGLIAITIHGVTLLGDPYLHPTITQIAIPFTNSYRPVYTGLGIIAGWSAAFLGLSFYARRWIGARRWRTIHRATILVWALAVVHTPGAGTDATQLWMRVILLATGIPIVFLFLRRIMPGEAKPARRVRAAQPAPESAGASR